MSKQIILVAMTMMSIISCSKKETINTPRSIQYINLNNTAVTSNNVLSIDLDTDGTTDFIVTKELRETNAGQDDILEFRVIAAQQNRVLVQDNGTPARKEAGVMIRSEDENGYTWDATTPAVIINRVLTPDPANSYWEGTWLQQYNKYLPIQFLKEGKKYNGWIKLSFSDVLPSRVIVHDAAYNKIADQPIQAGEK